jgi:hypothetical protein
MFVLANYPGTAVTDSLLNTNAFSTYEFSLIERNPIQIIWARYDDKNRITYYQSNSQFEETLTKSGIINPFIVTIVTEFSQATSIPQ